MSAETGIGRASFGMALVICSGLVVSNADGQTPVPPVAQFFAYKPLQKDVEYETPESTDFAKCKVEQERKGKSAGWVVLGPNGQVLRRFVDTDGNNKFDLFRYYNLGMEVYRDIDADENEKPEEFRWVNFGGSRWGLDKNGDGKIDAWKRLSAAEASREAINAISARDTAAFQLLLVTADDLRRLGVKSDVATKVMESVAAAPKAIAASKSALMGPDAKWMRFDAQMPSMIPADEEKATTDLSVYENAMAIVEAGGKSGLVQLGEMVLVGEVWKLTQAPLPIEGSDTIAAGGILMQPVLTSGATIGGAAPSPEMQKLLTELQALDAGQPRPGATPQAVSEYNAKRAELLTKLYNVGEQSDADREQWLRQLIGGLATAIQTGDYPEGLKRLKAIEGQLKGLALESYVAFRVHQAEYSLAAAEAAKTMDAEKQQEVQKKWLELLTEFVKKYPDAEDVPDAMLQLAVSDEFSGRTKEAVEWYSRLAKTWGDTAAGKRAAGAVRRFELKGKPLVLSGPSLSGAVVNAAQPGKTVLVVYWATSIDEYTKRLPELRQLYEQFKPKGFEIVGVCLDHSKEAVAPYLQTHKTTWPQIYEGEGLESPAALQYGVISLPTMFLVNSKGIVESRNLSIDELKLQLPRLLSK